MSLSDNLKTLVRASGKSLNQIEAECGLGKGVLSRFLGGTRDLTLETASRICDHLGLVLLPSEEVSDEYLRKISDIAGQAEQAKEVFQKLMNDLESYIEMKQAARAGTPDGVGPKQSSRGGSDSGAKPKRTTRGGTRAGAKAAVRRETVTVTEVTSHPDPDNV